MSEVAQSEHAFSPQHVLTEEEVELVKSTIMPPNSSDAELRLFVSTAQRRGLDPFSRQIYAAKRRQRANVNGNWVWVEKMSIEATIDGLRTIADRSKDYDGREGPEWCGEDGVWRDVWTSSDPPVAARVIVFRKSASRAWAAVAKWDEYKQTNRNGELTGMWLKMPANQLAKCAEALALRAAFPQDMGGLYTNDEMDQAANLVVEGEVVSHVEQAQQELAAGGDDTQTQDASSSEGGPEASASGSATAPPAEPAPRRKRRTKAEMEAARAAEAAAEEDPGPPSDEPEAEAEPEQPPFAEPEDEPDPEGEPEPDGLRPDQQRLADMLEAVQERHPESNVRDVWAWDKVAENCQKSFRREIRQIADLSEGEVERIVIVLQPFVQEVK